MSEEPTIVGVIHARGGSKRIPLKNIKKLAGKPLIAWMVDAALASKTLDRVIMSTDHDEIARIARECGAEVPFKRPAEIAEDVPSEMVSQHAVRFLEEKEGIRVDIVVSMQPTAPFCTGEDIDACVKKLIDTGAETVVSAREVRDPPEWMFRLEGDRAVSCTNQTMKGDVGVSQTLPKLYMPNGGIYATRRDVLMEQGLWMGKDLRFVVMPFDRSVDIDEPIDFLLAEAIAQQMKIDKENVQ